MDCREEAKRVSAVAGASVISEHRLASSFPSLWHAITPIGDMYWRTQNQRLFRFRAPIDELVEPRLRAFTSELAFEIFFQRRSNPLLLERHSSRIALAAVSTAKRYLSRFPDAVFPDELALPAALDESVQLSESLEYYFDVWEQGRPLVVRPRFVGCGAVSSCEGDVIAGNTLYEVKAVGRNFRITDLRQLLIYSALARAKGDISLGRLGLINPRSGRAWLQTIDETALAISGTSGVELLDRLIEALTDLASDFQY